MLFFSRKKFSFFVLGFIFIVTSITTTIGNLNAGAPFVSFDYSPNFSIFYDSLSAEYSTSGELENSEQTPTMEFSKLAEFHTSSAKMPSIKIGYLTAGGMGLEIETSYMKSNNSELIQDTGFVQSNIGFLSINMSYYLFNNPLVSVYLGAGVGPTALEIKSGISKDLIFQDEEMQYSAITNYINANFRSWGYQYFSGAEIKFNESIGLGCIYRYKDTSFKAAIPELDSQTKSLDDNVEIIFQRGKLEIENYKHSAHFIGFGLKIFLDELKTQNE